MTLAGTLHRLHRATGTALCALLASWFASGAVMTCSPFPSLSARERLASAVPLPGGPIELPVEVREALARGDRARLINVDARAVWVVGQQGLTTPLDLAAARRVIEQRFGAPTELEQLDEVDQWTVAQKTLPLFRARLAGGDEVYLAARSGELVQQSTRSERTWAWFGAIPHWVYFTWLREQRALWRYTVLTLSTLGMLVTLSGSIAGISVQRRLRRTMRDPALRWHQRLGLAFGLLAFSWLFSGALSLTPFQWSASAPPAIFAAGPVSAPAVDAARQACARELELRELELAPLAGHSYAVCLGRDRTRIVDLADGIVREALTLPGAQRETEPDAYFHPTHHQRDFPARYLRLDQADASIYIDPAQARVLTYYTDRLRLERWLFNGLHSLDLPGLYERSRLWLAVIWLAMAVGFTLSVLGGYMAVRRSVRRRRR